MKYTVELTSGRGPKQFEVEASSRGEAIRIVLTGMLGVQAIDENLSRYDDLDDTPRQYEGWSFFTMSVTAAQGDEGPKQEGLSAHDQIKDLDTGEVLHDTRRPPPSAGEYGDLENLDDVEANEWDGGP